MTIILNCNPIVISPSYYDNSSVNPQYTAILHVAQICASVGIPYVLQRSQDGWRIGFFNGEAEADIIENKYSYGEKSNLMESMGFKEDNHEWDNVTGYLSVLDAIKRIYNFFKMEG